MRGVLPAVLCLSLAACAGTPPIGADPGRGVILVGLDRAKELDGTPFVAELMAVDAAGLARTLYTRSGRPALVRLQPRKPFHAPAPTRVAFDVDPGDYVLGRIAIDLHDAAEPTGSRGHRDPVGGLLGLGIAYLAKEGQEASEGGPIEYVRNGVPTANAPRFTVRPGEVLYVGDILIGAEYRQNLAEPEPTPDEKNRIGGTVYRHTRLFAEYALDVPAARQFAASSGVGHRQFRTQALQLSSADRTMFPSGSKPPRDASLLTVVRARQAPTTTPIGTAAPAAAGPLPGSMPPTAPASAGTRSLMERFLAGEISKDEYDRERVGRAARP